VDNALPSTPYLDAAGRPRLRPSVTAFIDVLGFSQVSLSAGSLEAAQQVLEKIAGAISDSRAFVRHVYAAEPEAVPAAWALKFFSDNLVLGVPIDDGGLSIEQRVRFAIRCTQSYQLRMALNGLFVRGAICQGPLCLSDEIIFGSALIESYRLESKASIVPRVVLTEALRDLWNASGDAAAGAGGSIGEELCRDIDGWWFVNYLQATIGAGGVDWSLIARHKESVMASLGSTTAHDVLPKYGWTCRYHNVFCHWHRDDPGYNDRYRIERSDERSTILRPRDVERA
jgi:hypothetical protein